MTKQRKGRPVWTAADLAKANELKAKGCTAKSIAVLLGKPVSSVQSKLARTRSIHTSDGASRRPGPSVLQVRVDLAAARARQDPISAMLGEPPPGRREIVEAFLARQGQEPEEVDADGDF